MSAVLPSAMLSRFSRKDAARILRVPVQQLVAWQRAGLLPAAQTFSIGDLAGVRRLRELRGPRVSSASIRTSVDAMRRTLGEDEESLYRGALRDGSRLKFRHAGALLDPLTQQYGFDFEGAALGRPAVMRGAVSKDAGPRGHLHAQELFQQAVALEDRPEWAAAAADLYREVLATWPAYAPAAVNLGTILYNQQRYVEAEAQYRAAVEIDPDYALAFFDLGNVLDELQRLPEAIDAYARAIQLVPQYADAHYNLALAYERLGRRRRALRHWVVYARLDPAGPWSAHARSQTKQILATERLSIVARYGRRAG